MKQIKKVKKFIIKSFDNGYKKILIVTGKGLDQNHIKSLSFRKMKCVKIFYSRIY